MWDISGDLYHRQFWANYLRTIPVSVILYVVNCNEPSDRLKESMLYLHSLCMEPIAKDMQVFIVFNVSFYSNKDENYVENPFKKSQLEKLFKLKEKVP